MLRLEVTGQNGKQI